MKNVFTILSVIVVSLLIFLAGRGCDPVATQKIIHDSIPAYKDRIVLQEKQVEKWKDARSKIIYRIHFDTLATVDTVKIELLKADTIIKLDTKIIEAQDSIIFEQAQIIYSDSLVICEQATEIKKEKRKVKLWKGLTVVSLLLNLVH